MGANAPQWLFTSFVDAMMEIGATASTPILQAEARDLVSRWNEPGRHHHTIHHLINVLARIDELASITHDADVLRVSCWYHGAFLNRALEVRVLGMDPEAMCAPCIEHTNSRLTALGVSDDVVVRVAELLKALVIHHAPRSDLDAQVLLDADLAMLAESPQVYKKYREALREEFTDLDDLTYWRARRRVVRKFLSKDALFQSPLGQMWEEAARSNLEMELCRLEAKIAEVDPALLDDEDPVDLPSPEADISESGTLIIKRRQLRKNSTPVDDLSSTGVLPPVRSEAPISRSHDDEDGASSLETAIDAMDLPSTPAV
ncbi:MAG: hypothetical protein Q4C87_01055 [Actinomycetaceae bacterium]|nr:hypothetical protein [Actinomycetaceae bacterium]